MRKKRRETKGVNKRKTRITDRRKRADRKGMKERIDGIRERRPLRRGTS